MSEDKSLKKAQQKADASAKKQKKAKKPKKNKQGSKLSVLTKIAIPFIILAVMIMSTLVVMNMTVQTLEENQDTMANDIITCEKAVGDIRYCYNLANSMVESAEYKLENVPELKKAMEEQFDLVYDAAELYKEHAITEEEKGYADELIARAQAAEQFRLNKFEYYLRGERVDPEQVEGEDSNMKVLSAVANMNDATVKDIKNSQAKLTEATNSVRLAMTGAVLSLVLGYAAALYIIVFMVVNPIKKSSKELDDMVKEVGKDEGDLTKRITVYQRDEVGKLVVGVNTFIESLQGIISGIRGSASNLDETFNSVSNSVNAVNDSANDISAVMEELSATMEEVAATLANVNTAVEGAGNEVDGIDERSQSISHYASEMKNRAEELEKTAVSNKNTTETMINEILGSLETAIENSKSVEEVNALTEDILSISSQTNLLALNASIEAARAGEAGKGFAVVADEIRNLADSSRETANNIQEINEKVVAAVSDLSANSEKIIEYITENVMKDYDGFVDSGHQYSADSEYINNIMDEFSKSVAGLKKTMDEIVENINNVSTAVEQGAEGVTSAAENTSDLVGEISSITTEMQESNKIVGELNDNTNKFTNV
ncbi:MAG: methyl-accepting chemotaxis protein [Lachnospiraceae bacterium]|nr:methyl-accepting chemotaxis protein [Lachnospiraceae bacterium]